jgi:hypothetical protein
MIFGELHLKSIFAVDILPNLKYTGFCWRILHYQYSMASIFCYIAILARCADYVFHFTMENAVELAS